MSFGFKVEGLDEAINEINKLSKGIEPQELAYWTRTIENTAKSMCGDNGNDIGLKHTQGTSFNISYNDLKSRDCIIGAIQSHLSSMPLLLQGVFEKLATDLRNGTLNQ